LDTPPEALVVWPPEEPPWLEAVPPTALAMPPCAIWPPLPPPAEGPESFPHAATDQPTQANRLNTDPRRMQKLLEETEGKPSPDLLRFRRESGQNG
jgi:hypothetical protein